MGKAADIINNCLIERNMSQRKLAEKMGIVVQILNQQLKHNDIKVERFIDILDYLGYRVSIEDIGSIHKVTLQEGKSIREQKNERCKVWTEDDGVFTAIVCNGTNVDTKYFDSKQACIDYLQGLEK